MDLLVKTKTNSLYKITDTTWERLDFSEHSGELRTNSGSIKVNFVPKLGEPMILLTDTINKGFARVIYTSPVKEITNNETGVTEKIQVRKKSSGVQEED